MSNLLYRIVRPNLDLRHHQEVLAAVTKLAQAVVDLAEDLAAVWEQELVVVAVKSMSPTFVTSFPFSLVN